MNYRGMMKKYCMIYLAIFMLLNYTQEMYASGFYLADSSVGILGNASAGAAAVAEDASTVWFNPAGMTKLDLCGDLDFQSVAGGELIFPSGKFDNDGSTYNPCSQVINPTILLGGNGHNTGEPALVTSAYFVQKFRCRDLALGLGINSPFGLVTDYGHKWVGRYYAIRSMLLTFNFNPAIAYRVNNCLSIAAGFNVMYLHSKTTNAVDFGAILACNGLGGIPQEQDGKVIIKGDSWGYGGNIGILWEPWCGTRFGFAFRSEVKHRVSGKEIFKDIPADVKIIPALAALFQNTGVKSNATLPSIASLSGYHEMDSCWALLWDISWIKWKVVKRARFRFNNNNQNDAQITLRWKNTLRYSLGTSYKPNCHWVYRIGMAYDEATTPSRELISPRIPDSDRIWLAFGAGYACAPSLHLDFGYKHIFVVKAEINKTKFDLEEDRFLGGLKGSWKANADVVGAQLVWDF